LAKKPAMPSMSPPNQPNSFWAPCGIIHRPVTTRTSGQAAQEALR